MDELGLEEHRCKTCANQFSGSYCNVCGEKVIRPEDRKFKHFVGEFINALTFADTKLWRSLKLIVIAPGKLSEQYVEGVRQRFMKPLSLFFLANLLYFLFPFINTFTTTLDIQLSAFIYSDIANMLVDNRIEVRGITLDEYKEIYDAKTTELSKLLLIFMALILTVLFSIVHIGSKRDLIADHLTISLELMVFVLFYCIQVFSLTLILLSLIMPGVKMLFNDFWITNIFAVFVAYFCARMQYTFYGFSRLRLVLNTILCLAVVAIALSFYRGLLFFVTFWLT